MIVKELDPFDSDDVLAKAGRKAEEQMAFYLKREFADDEDVLVFNSLRFERDGDAAQIDHLVFHRFGAVVIESKSVTGKIRVNAHGEWSRVYGRERGMPSPILQARRQADFLGAYLMAHGDLTPDKDLIVHVRVAISDGGVFERPRGVNLDEVLKADQIPDAIRSIIRTYSALEGNQSVLARVINRIAGLDADSTLSKDDHFRYGKFLLEHHRPLTRKTTSNAPAKPRSPAPHASTPWPAPTTPRWACGHCGGRDLVIDYGYSYYFKCRSCKGSTAIKHTCERCGTNERVRKAGREFFFDCPRCHTSVRFFVNPVSM